MRLSLSSVITASMLVTVMIALMYPFMKSRAFIRRAGTSWVMLLLICVLFRMFLPVEFFYTYTFRFTRVLTSIRNVLMYNLVPGGKINLCIYHVCIFAWLAGMCISFWQKGRAYRKIRREILCYGEQPTEEIRKITAAWTEEYPELLKIELVYFPFITSPVLMGIRKPKIVLPEKEFTEQELKYILGHEVMHVRGHDTFWKLLIDILCTVYWWNPAFYLLKNEAFEVIEIKNDLRLTKSMSDGEKEEYLRCLRSVAALSAVSNYVGVVGFSYKPADELKRRFDMVINGASGSKAAEWGICLLVLALAFASSCVIFEPKYGVPENMIEVTESNTYIIEEDGVYKVYIDGEYWFDADSLEYLPGDIMENEKEREG